jgi:ABC-type oligopeptide transport system substrate-binding subunit
MKPWLFFVGLFFLSLPAQVHSFFNLSQDKEPGQVLYVAVPSLPRFLSPATAWTDTEKDVLDLLFEPLVRPHPDERHGLRYEPVLAEQLPASLGGRYRFTLVKDARWSDGEPLTAADVRHSVTLLQSTDLPGRNGLLRFVQEPLRWEGNPRVIDFSFRLGPLDPYESLSFHLLPQQFRGKPLGRADDEEFARHPVGSGPFRLQGQIQEDGRTYTVFQANPFYKERAKAAGSVREIRLFVPGKTLEKPRPHLALDVPMPTLVKEGYREVQAPGWRRIYFLAVNHRVARLGQVALRRFLALGLDRDKVLQEHFPKGEPLNGPFPLNSWANCPPPRVPRTLFQPELARSLGREVKKELGKVTLTLKFSTEDPFLEKVCAAMAEGWHKLAEEVGLELQIQLRGVPPHELRQAVHARDFELVYHHHDYASAAFSLWPLFDVHPEAVQAGGSNYLGYDNDARLQRLLHASLDQRQFSALTELYHDLYAHLVERMPLIPLWQLPRSFVVHPGLDLGSVDALRVFAHVEKWRFPLSK